MVEVDSQEAITVDEGATEGEDVVAVEVVGGDGANKMIQPPVDPTAMVPSPSCICYALTSWI